MSIKKAMISLVILGGVAYGGTVAYLTHFDHSTAPKLPENSPTLKDPVALAAYNAISEARCDYCHTKNVNLPFYFKVPGAQQLMESDRRRGLLHYRFESIIKNFQEGKPSSVEQISRIEAVIKQNRMPPVQYLLMHWHAALSAAQREAILAWVNEVRRKYYSTPGVAPQFVSEPVQPIPESLPVNAEKVALGRKLFFDKQLSGDGTLNCASCHALETGGVDRLKTSTGIHGQKGPINAPTVFNAVFNIKQFWNGRAVDLADQAAGPVTNPLEMGAHDWDSVVAKVRKDPEYIPLFAKVYGSEGVTKRTTTDAIAEFEKTLITPDSRFDQYLKGDDKAITAQERHGYQLFKSVGCSGCHSGVALGGDGFEVMGLEDNYFAARGNEQSDADKGMFVLTKAEEDLHRFKIPNLRNIELTAPYFHDGSVDNLEGAVKSMVKYQTSFGTLPESDIKDIVAFLKTLTGKYQGKYLDQMEKAVPSRASTAPEAEKPAVQKTYPEKVQ
ncbi:cytochrome-c peroxidase [Entomobacter blattae]|uniref:Di-hem cytochrome c peroxidase n=1 Tax=Entomobacter blattae TaxID=2762277 RepID=A0A7H1NRV8_9PROT|nr:cytochrome-c peroxidase [Entomobacter blattae]QNT78518.1 Di-hem cytochrome c peroxidase [Entomobacter blattae]